MKYWEMTADGLHRDGWSLGWVKFFSGKLGRFFWCVDAKKGDSPRLVVHTEELGAAFLELEMQCSRAGAAAAVDVSRN